MKSWQTNSETKYTRRPILAEIEFVNLPLAEFHSSIFAGAWPAPPRLQRMLLDLKKYDMLVRYKPGKSIPVTDALSRKYLIEIDNTSKLMEAHVHLIVSSLPVSDQKLKDIKDATEADHQCKLLKKTILDGWPFLRKECPVAIQ